MRIYNGDCLEVVKTFESEYVDLIYLDPPFNTGKDWVAFDDRFKPDLQARAQAEGKLRQLLDVFKLGYCDYMAIRLKELHRVLKPTGSLYLHCDPTASHYIKLILDAVFGAENYRNEVIWKRTFAHTALHKYGSVHDTILFYSKSNEYYWSSFKIMHQKEYIEKHFKNIDCDGRYFQPITLTGPGISGGESGKPWKGVDPSRVNRHWAIPVTALNKIGMGGEALKIN